jgi:hypothetical protein
MNLGFIKQIKHWQMTIQAIFFAFPASLRDQISFLLCVSLRSLRDPNNQNNFHP